MLDSYFKHSMLLVHLSKIADDNPLETRLVYHTSFRNIRTREMTEDQQVKQLFQGPNPKSKHYKKGEVYQGDRDLHSTTQITLHTDT